MKKSVLITGAGSGIGREVCLSFLTSGWNVIGLLRNVVQGESLKNACEDLRGTLSLIHVDLNDSDFLDSITNGLSDLDIDSLDVLINVAGGLDVKELNDIDETHLKSMMRINFEVPVLLTKELIPFLSNGGSSNIINITSMSGFQGSVRFPGLSIYGASKAALGSWTESIAVELVSKNIHANALAIGSVNTDMLQKAFPDYEATINPEEMAEYIYSFASLGYKFYNGKTLSVAITNP
jgi:NAD(P)-dependent dehydrogenase (short-subunit alcohol dehydrogenase family)